MNRKHSILALAAATLALSATFAQASGNPVTPEARAAEAAKQGPDALRRFVNRTRMIYAVDISRFYRHD